VPAATTASSGLMLSSVRSARAWRRSGPGTLAQPPAAQSSRSRDMMAGSCPQRSIRTGHRYARLWNATSGRTSLVLIGQTHIVTASYDNRRSALGRSLRTDDRHPQTGIPRQSISPISAAMGRASSPLPKTNPPACGTAASGRAVAFLRSTRKRIEVETRLRAVELRTDGGVLLHIDIAKLSLNLAVLVEVLPHVEMRRGRKAQGADAKRKPPAARKP
jgi:hypothetical protein